MSDCLVIFAREPVIGRVKTRLAAGIGPAGATEVYEALLEHTIETVRAAGVDAVVSLAEAPAEDETRTFRGLPVEVQGGGDLGRRMGECFDHRFADDARRVVLIGSDTAHLEPDHILTAIAALDDYPVVLGPAADGGYWLIGQQRPGFDLFREIPWSKPTTLDATRARLRSLDIAWFELETLPDIDTVEDLRRVVNDPRVDEELRRRLQMV